MFGRKNYFTLLEVSFFSMGFEATSTTFEPTTGSYACFRASNQNPYRIGIIFRITVFAVFLVYPWIYMDYVSI